MGYLRTAATVFLALAPTSSLASLFWSNYENCPQACDVVGPTPSNWTYYHALIDLEWCRLPLLFDLGLHTPLNHLDTHHLTIRACTVTPDGRHTEVGRSVDLLGRQAGSLNNTAPSTYRNSSQPATCGNRASSPERSSVGVRLAWGGPADADGQETAAATNNLIQYLELGPGCESTVMFAQSGQAVVGLYVGSQIDKASAASIVQDSFAARIRPDTKVPGRIGAQICGDQPFRAQTFGIYADSKGNISAVQAAVRDWSTGRCLSEYDQEEILEGQSVGIWSAILDAATVERKRDLHRRDTCRYTQADPGDGCWALANKCGISEFELGMLNGGRLDFCDTIIAGQYVCCSPGDLPDFSPQPNPDGSCKSYTVQPDDTCALIATANQISDYTKLEDLNKQTWGWTGCKGIQPGQSICLSKGTAPMPSPITGATCGPQVQGTVRPTNGTKLADLNPCPLNVCCNVWGHCGLSADFCIESPADTGAPGAAKPGSNGCISKCGMDIINSPVPPSEFRTVGYFESWNKERPCLNMDVSKLEFPAVSPIMGGKYTHIHFAFPDLTPGTFTVDVSKYQDQFDSFKKLSNMAAKKIVSFGGWDFSNNNVSYAVLRTMVSTELNRQKAARNIIRFMVDNNLDGVDFDWEYPGAIDIDGTPAGLPDEGENYLKFLRTVRSSLPAGKSLSIAAPSSFWYLKNFPIKAMSEILDYIIYMTYDLHGQWDAGNKWTSPGCPTGNCLRHHTNRTEVDLSLALITKAGVPSNKVVVGMPLYGRSFKMAQAGCTGPDCFFLGDRLNSQAAKGVCTGTAGYISNIEIKSIQNSNLYEDLYGNRMIREIQDKAGDIMVYDETEWVSWMKPTTYILRGVVYKSRNFGGTSDWAIDLNYDFKDGGDGGWNDPNDEGFDEEFSCDYDRTFKDLDDLNNNAGGISLFCRQVFAIQVLEDMLDNLYAEYQSADNGYDTKFDAYVRYINRITPYAINDYMTKKGGLNFFDCSKSPAIGHGESRHCADFSEAERNEGYFDMTITLRDREGFFTDLLNDTGVAEEWINFNGHERDVVYCQNPGAGMCPPTSGIRDWYGWPAKNGDIDVANPKEIITESMGSIDELKLDIMVTKWDIISGMWDGDVDDVVQVFSVPIFMLAEAVEGMKKAKEMGEEEEKWEEQQARDKAKNLILTIIGAALFIVPFLGQLGATLAGAATLARFALIAGEVANAAFAIYGMVDDPNSAVMGLLGMMFGLGSFVKVGRTPQGFREMAAKRADLRTGGGVSKIGGMFQKRDDTLQNIIKLCR